MIRPGRYKLVEDTGPAPEWISTSQLAKDSITLAGVLPPNISGVVGIPRSGMIPATIISTLLHLPLWELTSAGPVPMNAGSRGPGLYRVNGPLAVIDDTSWGGAAMATARRRMRGLPAVYGVVYALPLETSQHDLHVRHLHSPHLLEWNLPNNGPFWGACDPVASSWFRAGCACDLDGVLLHDELSGGKPGTPYLLPRAQPVRLIVTGRSESSRNQTEATLRAWGVRWERLEMLPDDVELTSETAARHKAEHYGKVDCGFFMESCPEQAFLIHKITGKPVICPRVEKVLV